MVYYKITTKASRTPAKEKSIPKNGILQNSSFSAATVDRARSLARLSEQSGASSFLTIYTAL